MKILVTGGTGVIGEATIPELLARGHAVRLLSRHATEDAKQWNGVEPFEGEVAEAATIVNAASGCDAILHIAGIENVGGTRNILAEAERAGVTRFVFVSSLGSKLDAETLVQRSPLAWTIVRAGTVYGPGDEVISTILKMVRTLPAVPVINDGNQEFQPIWAADLAKVLAAAIERDDVRGEILEAVGSDTTTMNDLLERFAKITDRKFVRVPVPMTLAQLDTNVVRGRAALDVLGVTATPLERGLRILADAMPEVLPAEGFGSMEHKRVWADIRGTRHTPASLLAIFRERTNEIMPIEFAAEPGAPEQVAEGATMTGSLPLRGNIQIRVEIDEPTRIVFGTLEGHPLAGTVEFTTAEVGGGVRFAIDTWTRASNFLDWLGMNTLGRPAQSANWRAVVQRMIDASGGTSDGVHQEVEKLDEEERLRVEKRVRELVQARKRDETSVSPEQTPQR